MISFNQVPTGMRVPFLYAEFNSSNAQQGASIMPYQLLVLGQMLAAGSATANVATLVSSEAQAISLFGAGSMLHCMLKRIFQANQFTPVYVVPQADAGGSAAAAGTITVTGTATAAGTLAMYIAGRLVQVGVSVGDTATVIGANIVAAMGLINDLPVTGSNASGVVTITARNKGPLGNNIDIRQNYYSSDVTPAGVSIAIVAMAGGSGVPSLTAAISAMGEAQWNIIACPYNDGASLTAIETELTSRWGPTRQNDGVAFTCVEDTQSNLVTFGSGRNSPFVVCPGIAKCPMPSYEIAASMAAVVAYYGNIDPARPFQTLALPGILAPALTDRFTLMQRQTLLLNGIATLLVDSGGNVLIERAITMYQKNAAGAPDTAYLDVNTPLTLSYLRYDFRNYWLTKYSRYKLASDNTRFGPGQAIMTPKVAKAEAINKFNEWMELGLVQNPDQFKRDLVVQINSQDPNRLDFLLPPNLVGQLMVTAAQIGFLLGSH